jgi:hypothetical protein
VGDSVAPFRRPHGTALCSERRMRGPDLACVPSVIHVGASIGQLRAAVQRRQGPGSSDGRFVTLRVCHWTAVGIRRIRGQTSAAKPCVCSAANCVRLRRLGRFVRSAFSRILCIVHLYAVKTTEKGSLGTLLYAVKNTCTQSKKHLYAVKTTRRALCTSPAVGLLKSFDGRTVATAPFCPRTPRRRPAPRRLRSGRTPLPRP